MKGPTYIIALVTINSFAIAQINTHESTLNKNLISELDTIYKYDQKFRLEQSEIIKTFGYNSKEEHAIRKVIHGNDSLNQIQVENILDKNGWLGADVVGTQGNKTLFLVVQHSNQKMQEKYIPMMRDAVKKGKAKGSSLALLEDRLLLGQGKMQVYGSQVLIDSTGTYVDPIEDVDNVDKRRAEIGLQSMAEYLQHWKLTWDIEKYKKELPNSPSYKRFLAVQEFLRSQKK